ncbi:MAG: CDP-glycerol glycerophosphotransferase family protein [Oleiphilus sp.]
MKSVYFDIPHIYYLPQYAPVIEKLQKQQVECHAMLYKSTDDNLKLMACDDLNLISHWTNSDEEAATLYREAKADWVIFGNDYHFLDQLAENTQSALLFHGSGTGVKNASLSPGLGNFDVRFVSGPGRMKIFAERFPSVKLFEVGFAKLDPLRHQDSLEKLKFNLSELGLDPKKKTMLYAPTFYPSSIENMSKTFPKDFADYNILIKAHDFTLNKSKYKHQLKKLNTWSHEENVYFADAKQYSLIPFMATADIMVTDTSSAIFEFASLNKPVIICNFPRLRWTYRGPLKYRLRNRLDASTLHYQDVAAKANRYKNLKNVVDQHAKEPSLLEANRMSYSQEIMGNMDGQASNRIVDILFNTST